MRPTGTTSDSLQRAAEAWAVQTMARSPSATLFLIWRTLPMSSKRCRVGKVESKARQQLRDEARVGDADGILAAVDSLNVLTHSVCRLCENRDTLVAAYRECLDHGLDCSAEEIVTDCFVSETVWGGT